MAHLDQEYVKTQSCHENEVKILRNQLSKFSADLVTMDISKSELNEQLQCIQQKYFALQINKTSEASTCRKKGPEVS